MTASSTDRIYWDLKGNSSPMLDSCSIDKLSIKIYENKIFSSDFIPIHVYVFRFSFLTTLNLYKDYFKGRQRLRECEAKFCSCKLWLEIKFALVHLSLEKLLHLYTVGFCDQGVSWSSLCWWTKELCSQYLSQVGESRV